MTAGIIGRRNIKHRNGDRKKNNMANKPQPTIPIGIVTATKAGSILTITFNQPVGLKGVPAYTVTGAAVTALGAAMTSPTVMSLTFSGAVTAATFVNIPYEEPAIRNSSGGFVGVSTFPVT